ncbi:MAG: hypothetical protein Q4B52_03540 [Tissierellia bacterium]|nr:hypothetical protein [Tissierellia bacterium]
MWSDVIKVLVIIVLVAFGLWGLKSRQTFYDELIEKKRGDRDDELKK